MKPTTKVPIFAMMLITCTIGAGVTGGIAIGMHVKGGDPIPIWVTSGFLLGGVAFSIYNLLQIRHHHFYDSDS